MCSGTCLAATAAHNASLSVTLYLLLFFLVFQVSSPALASAPLSDLAGIIPTPKQAIDKTLNKLDSLDPPKGVPGPEVQGQFRK